MSATARGIELSRDNDLWVGRFRAMGGPCEVLVETCAEAEARKVADIVAACAWRIEAKFSRYRPDNIIARINASAGKPVEVDSETANLLDFAAVVHRLSKGMFDITSGVLRKAWTFDGGHGTPARAEIDALLPLIGWPKVQWSRPVITLLPGMQLDLGGIGKEYAVDQATQLAAQAVSSAVLVNFGGDLAVTRARASGRPWRVGIEGFKARIVELGAGALATSGDTYRYVVSKGQRLSHVLDPRHGRPVSGAPRSVTVAAQTCTNAGMLTTLAMLRGLEAEAFLHSEGVKHWVQRDPSHPCSN